MSEVSSNFVDEGKPVPDEVNLMHRVNMRKIQVVVNKYFNDPTPFPSLHRNTIPNVKVSVAGNPSSPSAGVVTLHLPPEYHVLDFVWVLTVSDNVLVSLFRRRPEGKEIGDWRRYPVQEGNKITIEINVPVAPKAGMAKLMWHEFMLAYCFSLCDDVKVAA